jgi:hypothetical protein
MIADQAMAPTLSSLSGVGAPSPVVT